MSYGKFVQERSKTEAINIIFFFSNGVRFLGSGLFLIIFLFWSDTLPGWVRSGEIPRAVPRPAAANAVV